MKTKITILFVLCTGLYLNAQEIEDRLKKVEIKLNSITKKEDKFKSTNKGINFFEDKSNNPFTGFIFVKTGRNTYSPIAEMVYFW